MGEDESVSSCIALVLDVLDLSVFSSIALSQRFCPRSSAAELLLLGTNPFRITSDPVFYTSIDISPLDRESLFCVVFSFRALCER